MRIWTIYKKELNSYFLSPMAYVLLGFFLLLSGYFFSTFVLGTQYAMMSPILGNMLLVLMFTSPILTMRLLADELRSGTDQLLMTSPLTITDVVIGKFLAALTVYLVALVITFLYPIYLKTFGSPDMGPIYTGYLGMLLIGAAFIAVGIFASSLTENQMIAGIIGFALLLLFWIISWLGDVFNGGVKTFIQSLSLLQRFDSFQKGLLSLNDIVFFLSFTFFFIFLSIMVIDKRRWS